MSDECEHGMPKGLPCSDCIKEYHYEQAIREDERERCVQAVESLDRQNEKYPALIFRHEAIDAIKAPSNTPEGE